MEAGDSLMADAIRLGNKYAEEKAEEEHMLHQHDKLLANLIQTDTIEYEDIKDKMEKFIGDRTTKSPVSVLNELVQTMRGRLEFVDIGTPTGPSHKPRFVIVAVVNGRPYIRVRAGSKKQARNGAGYMAWNVMMTEEIEKLKCALHSDCRTTYDRIATMAHIQYLELVLLSPFAYTGRRVLAAIVMTRGQNDLGTVITLATGNRCIAGANLSIDGRPVNDGHAEVIARRSFVRFLYWQLEQAIMNNSSIFHKSFSGKYAVKDGISFHFYVSQAPCGDAATFTRSDPASPIDRQPIFDNKQEGLLRTKLEDGEGTPPAEYSPHQTLVGLKFGTRLKTMSCSDKVCKWNLLGLQGALLSHFMEPIYMASLVVGDVYSYGHISRAVYYRLAGCEGPPLMSLPLPYKATLPNIENGAVKDLPPETEKTLATCINWSYGDQHTEILEGNTGLVASSETDKVARISKLALYQHFKNTWQLINGNTPTFENYYDAKQNAQAYQESKRLLFKKFEDLNQGSWVHKPPEIDYFS